MSWIRELRCVGDRGTALLAPVRNGMKTGFVRAGIGQKPAFIVF